MGRHMIPGEDNRDPLAEDEEGQGTAAGAFDFAKMLDESEGRSFKSLRSGAKIEGRIVSIGEGSVFVDVGQRSEGVVEKTQFTPEELAELKLGQVLSLFVVSVGAQGIELSKRLRMQDLGFEKLQEAQQSGIPVEGKVTGENKGGFVVDLPGAKGFVPFSQMDLPPTKPAAEYMGKTFQFRVMRIERREAVLSRVSLLRQEQEEQRARLLATLEPDQTVAATVVKIENFGIFVDIGAGINALVPRSEASWSRVNDLSEVVTLGQKLMVRLMQIDHSGPKLRVSASLKQAGTDPWEAGAESIQVGQTIKGTVTKLMPFGAFVELLPGLEGLIHISEMSAKKRVLQPGEIVKANDAVEVKILAVDRVAKRISLSLKALQGEVLDEETRTKYVKQQEKDQEGRGVELVNQSSGFGSAFGDAFLKAQQGKEKRK